MKVVISSHSVYPFHSYGGIEKRVYYLSRHLSEQGIDVEVLSSSPRTGQRNAFYDGIRYVFLPPFIDWSKRYAFFPSLSIGFFSINLAKHLKKRKFDILHTYGGGDPYVYLHLRERAPVVFEPLEEIYEFKGCSRQNGGLIRMLELSLMYTVKKKVDRYCIKNSEAIASEGRFQTDILVERFGIDEQRIFELPVGVDILSIERALERNTLSREDLGILDDDFLLISINRLDTYKGIDYLLDAFSILKQKRMNSKLILVGTGPEEDRLMKKIIDDGLSDSVIHLKNIPEKTLYRLCALSDVYVSPSSDAGSVQSVIESMACGLPVVSTGQDFWVKSGINGYVVPKRDSGAIACAILKIYNGNKCKKFGNESRRIAKRFDYKIIAKTAIEKYQDLLERYPRR